MEASFELLLQNFLTTKDPFNYFYFLLNKLYLFEGNTLILSGILTELIELLSAIIIFWYTLLEAWL